MPVKKKYKVSIADMTYLLVDRLLTEQTDISCPADGTV